MLPIAMGNCFGGNTAVPIKSMGGRKIKQSIFQGKMNLSRIEFDAFKAEARNHSTNEDAQAATAPTSENELRLEDVTYEMYLVVGVKVGDKLTLRYNHADPDEDELHAGALLPGALSAYRAGTPVTVLKVDETDVTTPFQVQLPKLEGQKKVQEKWLAAEHIEHYNQGADTQAKNAEENDKRDAALTAAQEKAEEDAREAKWQAHEDARLAASASAAEAMEAQMKAAREKAALEKAREDARNPGGQDLLSV